MSDFLKLKKSNCKNCYKCIRNCPVKSIRFSGGQANIIGDDCILCGQCFVVCPQNAKEIVSSIESVKVMLASGLPVIASVAPSFIANSNGIGIASLRKALQALGFADAEETAVGATIVKNEYERMLASGDSEILISSCCHSINLLIRKYYPSLLPFLADTISPMQAHCLDLKRRYPGCKTVFIGPCLSKKDEADSSEDITDAVLTFEELSDWMDAESVALEPGRDETEESRARFFPTAGGILKTMTCRDEHYAYIAVDGVENCIAALKDIENGGLRKCFIEMSACAGSCTGGPVMEKYHRSPIRDYIQVSAYAGTKDFVVEALDADLMKKPMLPIENALLLPAEDEIDGILKQMGKIKEEDELNCGSCGYNSCRDKAVAVFQGKADISMCMPFLMGKAESFSDQIINNTPNGVIVLNEALEVQQINNKALEMMNLRRATDVLGEPVVRILDPADFIAVRQTGRNIKEKRAYWAEYRKYIEETITYDRNYKMLICILRDVTREELERAKKETMNRQTIETADKVVEKQLRVVQEIASLLGETAAETKIALTKLKESISDE
jgi:iron only hydrogenase large subunit-like protein/uncharacterized Fe-S cluster-containing protein